jgi:glycerol-3-phosphate acyltransferase PlsY
MLFVFGFFMIIGHCLPITYKFQGGRGIFIYIGLMIGFVYWVPMLISLIIVAVLFFYFKQIRFAQYFIVLILPFLSLFWQFRNANMRLMVLTALLMGVLNFVVSKRLKEI